LETVRGRSDRFLNALWMSPLIPLATTQPIR
jgi:hypothetical protein